MIDCDHVIGMLRDTFLRPSNIKSIIEDDVYSANRYRKNIAFLKGEEKPELICTADFFDRRKGYMTMFNNCPYCGVKVDWKAAKQSVLRNAITPSRLSE
jgi:hypothetical protein